MKPKNRFSKTLSVALLIFVTGLLACKKEDDVYTLNADDGIDLKSIITILSVTPGSMEADGVTPHTITIQIHKEAADTAREIQVTTSLGAFANGRDTDTVVANASGKISVKLTSTTPGIAKITAKIKIFSVDTLVEFKSALPHDLLVTANNQVIDTTQSIVVTTDLFRDSFKGQVSDPIKVFYKITPASTPYALFYPAFSYSDDKKATMTIANPFHLQGDFVLKVVTFKPTGDTLSRILPFKIK